MLQFSQKDMDSWAYLIIMHQLFPQLIKIYEFS